MTAPRSERRQTVRAQRPKATTVFAAAFLAGAAAAVGLNRTLDVHLAQRRPRVESEPIFVALRSLPQGAPLTVWDVALRDWPKAMLPAAAMRPRDSFEGMVLKHPLREGQPILSVQLAMASVPGEGHVAEASVVPAPTAPAAVESSAQQTDLWAPAEVPAPVAVPAESVSQAPPVETSPDTNAVASIGELNDAPALDPEPALNSEPTLDPEAVAETVAPAAPVHEEAVPERVAATQIDVEPNVEPIVAEPLVVAPPADTDVVSEVAPASTAAEVDAAPQRSPAMRYLVVPERVALEADRSFLPAPAPVQDAPPPAVAVTVAKALPKKVTPSAPSAQIQQGRKPRPAGTRTSSSRDGQPQRPPRSATGQPAPAKQPEKMSFLRSMMPSLSLGMGAVEPAAKTAANPESKSGQSTRPATRGFGLFR